MRKLNPKEELLLQALNRLTAQKGYPPSVRELCEVLGYRSPSTVQMYLDRLETEGYIKREGGKSRSISAVRERTFYPIMRLGAGEAWCKDLTDAVFEGSLDFCYCGELPRDARLFALEKENGTWVILQCAQLPLDKPRVVKNDNEIFCCSSERMPLLNLTVKCVFSVSIVSVLFIILSACITITFLPSSTTCALVKIIPLL